METDSGVSKDINKKWYDENASFFKNSIAIEHDFLNIDQEAQIRLNYFKLWHILNSGQVSFKGKNILEYGCGHARMAIEFKDYNTYTGIDFSEELVKIGEKRITDAGLSQRARLIVSDCLKFDAPKESFDIVCSLGMFSNITEPAPVLEKMYAYLKPGGVMFIDWHHSSVLYNTIRYIKQRKELQQKKIYTKKFFTETEVRNLFLTIGLTNIRIFMREYPFLGKLYARSGFKIFLNIRNALSMISLFNVLGTDGIAFGYKPVSS